MPILINKIINEDGNMNFNRILSILFLLLLMGCNNKNVTLKFTCDPDFISDDKWVYIYRLQDNDYHIADSCMVKDHRFQLKFNVPFEYRYTLILPSSRPKQHDIILRPGENYNLHLSDTISTRYTYISLEALPQSPASKIAFYIEQNLRKAANPIRTMNARINLLDNADTSALKILKDSIDFLRNIRYLDLPIQLLNDSIVKTSPYASYELLLGTGRNLPQYDSILQIVQNRFPDYPPLATIKTPAPQSYDGWCHEARIMTILGRQAPPPWTAPAIDTIPDPKNVIQYKVGDNMNNWKILTADNSIVEPLKNITTNYILIDFWASWCAPCMSAIENNIRPYAESNGDRLTVCAISIDKDYTAWKNAINKLQTEKLFHHYQLQQPSTEYKRTLAEFGIKAIPFTILLDKERNIIAVNPPHKNLLNIVN